MLPMDVQQGRRSGRPYGRLIASAMSVALLGAVLFMLLASSRSSSTLRKAGDSLAEKAAATTGTALAAKPVIAKQTQKLADGHDVVIAESSENYNKKVKVRLYMESRCPACKRFVSEIAASVVQAPGMNDIMDFKLVPFGNGDVGFSMFCVIAQYCFW
jgi:protein-disulfide isomerase